MSKIPKKFKAEYRVTVSWAGGTYIGYSPYDTLKDARRTKRHFDKSTPHLKHEHLILKIVTTIVN